MISKTIMYKLKFFKDAVWPIFSGKTFIFFKLSILENLEMTEIAGGGMFLRHYDAMRTKIDKLRSCS